MLQRPRRRPPAQGRGTPRGGAAAGKAPSTAAGSPGVVEEIGSPARDRRGAVVRLVLLLGVFVAVAVALQLSGWRGPEQLRAAVESTGAAGAAVFVLGYAILVLVPTPASLLTLLGGVLFGLGWGVALSWLGALLGAVGGFWVGRLLGRSAVDRVLGGRLRQADALLSDHGFLAVLAVRLLPVFPFTPLSYACGLVSLRFREYVLGTAAGILPGSVAYTAVGASGANPVGIVIGATGLLLLVLAGGALGRRLLVRAGATAQAPEEGVSPEDQQPADSPAANDGR